VEHRADQVIVDIADAGPGLPMLAGLATAPLPSTNGSGLGLLAARQFLEACGGCLSFMTAERGGTLCRLQLPAAPTPSFAGEG
jgi:C4-dicarboxylate-specific signal transduction histidine kinase